MCWRCDAADAIARRIYSPETRHSIERGQDAVAAYMEQHGVGFPEAVDALAQQRRVEFAELKATYAELHDLDDDAALQALWTHGVDGTGAVN